MQDPNAKMPEGSQQDPLNVFGRIRERIRRRRESPIDMPEVEDQAAAEPVPEKPPKTQAPRSAFEPAPEPPAEPAPALEFPTQRATRWGGRGNYFYEYTPPSGNTPARIRLHGGPNNNRSGLTITEASHPEAFRAIMDEYSTMSQKGNVQPYVSLQEYRDANPRNNEDTDLQQAVRSVLTEEATSEDAARGTPPVSDFSDFLQQYESMAREPEESSGERREPRPRGETPREPSASSGTDRRPGQRVPPAPPRRTAATLYDLFMQNARETAQGYRDAPPVITAIPPTNFRR